MGDKPSTILQALLKEYPRFYDKRDTSLFNKVNQGIGDSLRDIKHQQKILDKRKDIDRPLHLWREQYGISNYDIEFEIKLENIKQVKLYREGNKYSFYDTVPDNILEKIHSTLENATTGNFIIYTDGTTGTTSSIDAEDKPDGAVASIKASVTSIDPILYHLAIGSGQHGSQLLYAIPDASKKIYGYILAKASSQNPDAVMYARLTFYKEYNTQVYDPTYSSPHGFYGEAIPISDEWTILKVEAYPPVGATKVGIACQMEGEEGTWTIGDTLWYSLGMISDKPIKEFNTPQGKINLAENCLLFDSGILPLGTEEYTEKLSQRVVKNILSKKHAELEGISLSDFVASANGTATIQKSISTDDKPESAVSSVKAELTSVNSVTSYFTLYPYDKYPVQGSTHYYAMVYGKGYSTDPTHTIYAGLYWYDSAGNYITSTGGKPKLIDGEWTICFVDAISPANAAYVRPFMNHTGTAGTFTSGDSLCYSMAMVSDTLIDLWVPGQSEVIPSTKYCVVVETYDGLKFAKGFPENDTFMGDFYDHDTALDEVHGTNLIIPRRNLKTDIAVEDLPDTFPPFCNSATEWDKTYADRIKEYMEDLKTVPKIPLPILELKKLFQIKPTIVGRWRSLCRQNKSLQNKMFMLTEHWHPAAYDVLVNLSDVPANIELPTGDYIHQILKNTFPLSKVPYFSFVDNQQTFNPSDVIMESIDFENTFNTHFDGIYEDIVCSGTTPIDYENDVLMEEINATLSYAPNLSNLREYISLTAYDLILSYDTETDFANGTHSATYVSGYGSNAKVQVDVGSKNKSSLRDDNSNWRTEDTNWGVLSWSYDAENGVWKSPVNNTGQTIEMNDLSMYSFNPGIPSDATILGIAVKFSSYPHQLNPCTSVVNLKYGSKVGAKSVALPGANYNVLTVGGATDLWGKSWTPDELNSVGTSGLRVTFDIGGIVPNGYVTVGYGQLFVYYRYKGGTYMTSTILAPENGYAWDHIDVSTSIPSGCAINFDILKASDNTVLLSNQTGTTINISGLPYVDLILKAKLTANGTTSPSIDWMKVYNKRHY